MTKAGIVENILFQLGFSKKEYFDLLESVIPIIKFTFEDGVDIKILDFGNFKVKQKKDRIDRNPVTGYTLTIEARRVLTFKPSTKLKYHLNKSSIMKYQVIHFAQVKLVMT
jgi:integration host factor subunit alpha